MTRPTRADRGDSALVSSRSRAAASATPAGPPERLGGTRVAVDEPLAASWDPAPPEPDPAAGSGAVPNPGAPNPGARHGGSAGTGRLAKLVSAYGWRLWALPVLVAVTVLTLLEVAAAPPGSLFPDRSAGAAYDDTPGSDRGVRLPLIPNPVGGLGFHRVKASAELPGGGPFTVQGAGTWRVVPGAGKPFGTGQLVTYTVEIEDGIVLEGGPGGFATTVDNTLNNPKSWIGSGHYQFRRIDDPRAADLRISLTSQMTTRGICGYRIPFDASCWKGDEHRVVINVARWIRGAVAFQGNVVQYQQYVVNHEVGHGLGFEHTSCPVTGQLAPVMTQQTWGVANDYLAALGTDHVEADGKVCEPNAWPFPTVN